MRHFFLVTLIIIILYPVSIIFAEQVAREEELSQLANNEIRDFIYKDFILDALMQQSLDNERLSLAELKSLDRKWIAEKHKSKRILIDRVMNNDISKYLQKIQDESEGLYTVIVVMDNRGLALGQSMITQHYWHGNQEFWKKSTLGGGTSAVTVRDVEFNDNTQKFQAEIAIAIVSGETNLGLVMVGIDVEVLDEDK